MMIRLMAIALLWCAGLPAAHAHLMVAQRGTLNLVGNGAFMVMSVPVSALTDTDDDGDGKLSIAEFQLHRSKIGAAIESQVQLLDKHGSRPLEGMILALSPSDEAPMAPAEQLVVMGRFALADPSEPLRLQMGLFGKHTREQAFQVTVTRADQKQLLMLSPDRAARALFPSSWAVFADYAVLGAEHIVTGLDHLLFLLVVLAAGWGWRHVLLALSVFTVGHAITLMISVWGGVAVPADVVEPTIAATIIGIAAFDLYARYRNRVPSPWLRLSLVFGCALVHGLGLATGLTELGLDSQHQLQSLAGFNVGIEAGQLAVAVVALFIVAGIKRLHGASGVAFTAQAASFLAMSVGSIWLVQRVIAL